jgi:transcriptional regulator with XRE-family HTH domain
MNTHPPAIGTTFQSVLGAVINSLRTNSERNITQTDIAEQLGINVSTWSRIERGESSLSIEQLVLVAAFLNLPLSGLFEFVEERIDELRKQGVKVAVSKEALQESKILQLSTAQLIGISISSPLGPLGVAAAAYGLYKTLLMVKKKV